MLNVLRSVINEVPLYGYLNITSESLLQYFSSFELISKVRGISIPPYQQTNFLS